MICEVWEANKAQATALESVVLVGAKHIVGCTEDGQKLLVRSGLSIVHTYCYYEGGNLN